MKKYVLTWLIFIALLMGAAPLRAQAPQEAETKAQRDARMEWWREAKFGMFIHWGVYSVPAGYYNGKPVPGIGEWIMNKAKIPMTNYQAFAKQFDPEKFDANAWVAVAKNAGMKYIVITSKHHDGFAMFDSKVSDWNIVKATPFHRDPLKELAAACRKAHIKLGFYYSQAQDWNNGGAASGGKWDPAQTRNMDDYIDKIAVPQVREILSNYGEFPAVLWWDTPQNMNPQRAAKLYAVVKELRPNIIMNNRLGGGFKGDTETPEQKIPAKGFPGRDWETCMTLNDTWGFKRDDNHWKSPETILRNLIDIASKGGNYLLNVGPTSEGQIPEPSIERLAVVGQWMKVNGEAIYGTTATVFGGELGGTVKAKDGYGGDTLVSAGNDWRCTVKAHTIYIHVFNWPASQTLTLPGLQSRVKKAYLLADPEHTRLKFEQTDAGVTLHLPATAPDPIASVIRINIADTVAKVAPDAPTSAK